MLNTEWVPYPSKGTKQDAGGWSAGSVRSILTYEKYIGIVDHGGMIRRKVTDPDDPTRKRNILVGRRPKSERLRHERPDLRIIDDELWNRVQARFARNADLRPFKGGKPYKAGRLNHLLSGIGRCARCGGAITIANTKTRGGVRTQCYVCGKRRKQAGRQLCGVKATELKVVTETALVNALLDNVLSREVMKQITDRVIELAQQDRGEPAVPVARLEKELVKLRAEQRRYAALVAKAPDVDALLDELRQRQARIASVEATIAAAKAAERAAPRAAQLAAD